MNQIEQQFYDAILNDEMYDTIESIEPQYPIGIYIVDFYIKVRGGDEYIIEIDGHEAHKTKEQRFKDYRRERFLQEEGKIVFRFMASEVYVNAAQCARWVLETINRYEEKRSNEIVSAYESGAGVR